MHLLWKKLNFFLFNSLFSSVAKTSAKRTDTFPVYISFHSLQPTNGRCLTPCQVRPNTITQKHLTYKEQNVKHLGDTMQTHKQPPCQEKMIPQSLSTWPRTIVNVSAPGLLNYVNTRVLTCADTCKVYSNTHLGILIEFCFAYRELARVVLWH